MARVHKSKWVRHRFFLGELQTILSTGNALSLSIKCKDERAEMWEDTSLHPIRLIDSGSCVIQAL